ncbi:MAG: hypothetical protein K2P57_02605 [Burkholderiales bacterium]|nr:hypothetical protein [Burkholderiales bacterium]
MRCFARWHKDNESGAFFRDQTILQFGDSWELRASFVLLNPGSAVPLNETDQTGFLRSQSLPFFVEPTGGETYVEFSIDRLMNDVIRLFTSGHSGGTIKLYNLFNLKNQHSGEAMEQFSENQSHPKMFATDQEIKFYNAPVIIASGGKAFENARLERELARYISLANASNLYKIASVGKESYSIAKAMPDKNGLVDSYHPSFTFKYGNSTILGDLSHNDIS